MIAVFKNFSSKIRSLSKENERSLLDFSGVVEISKAKSIQVKVTKYLECISSGH